MEGRSPWRFQDPADVTVSLGSLRVLSLLALVELKLASGISAPHRLKDLADVQELIRALKLPRDFVDKLNAYVRDKYIELWTAIAHSPPEE